MAQTCLGVMVQESDSDLPGCDGAEGEWFRLVWCDGAGGE